MIVNKYKNGGGGSPFDPTQYYTKSQVDAEISGATEGLASEEYVDGAIEEALSGITLDGYWTSAETKTYVDGQVSGLTEYIEDVERVAATALTELHTDILALSAATPDMSNYYTKSEVDAAITSATQDFVTEDALTGYTSMQDFEDFQDAISVKEEVIASALTELHDEIVVISGNTDLTNYYDKTAVDGIIATETGRTEGAYIKKSTLPFAVDNVAITKLGNDNVLAASITNTSEGNTYSVVSAYFNTINGKEPLVTNSQDKENIVLPTFNDVSTAITESIVTETARTESTYAKKSDIPSLDGYWTSAETKNYVDDAISGLTDMMETKEEVIAAALVDLDTNKVGSTDVHTMVKLTQAQYDALTTKDPNTFYIIIGG